MQNKLYSIENTLQRPISCIPPWVYGTVLQIDSITVSSISFSTGKQLFNEAMKHGHVKSCNTAALFVGAAGSGKTCSKHVIMNEEPPEVRISTPIAERPVKVMKIRTVEGLQWHRLSPADQKEILANIMALIAAEEGESSDQASPTRPSLKARFKALLRLRHGRSHSGWSLKRTKHASPSKLRVNVASHGSSPTLDTAKTGDTSTPKQSSTSDTDKPVGVAAVETLLESSTTETELARMIELSPGAEKQLEVNLVHITDSGGQPQFHEILPVFLRRTSIYIFVTKLSEGLDERPLVMYFDSNGNLISKPFPATHTNMQIFRHCIRTLQSHRSQRGGKAPYIMIIGTHQDLEHLCSETREAKNHKLAEVLLPEFQDEVIYFNLPNKEFIFPLNAKSPGKEEWEIAEEIRKIIMLKCAAEPDDIPLRWYCLELKLQEIAQALGRDVMSKEECFAVALRLHFDSESFEAALEYLDGLNIIFYYPDTLPDVVFTDTQVLLDKVTELVQLSYELKAEGAHSEIKARGGEDQKFQDLALVTPKFLKSFNKHYFPGLFTPLELVKLFRALLIFADFSDTEYFMPSLLQRISSEEVAEHRIGSSAAAAPLILYFSHGGPLLGMFCSLIVFLLSAGNCFPSPWKLLDHLGTPVCLYRNCVKFTIPHHPGTVTLIDAFSFFELHVSSPDNLCGFVHDAVFTGLKKAAANLSYNNSVPEVAFFCSCSTEEPHPATVSAAQNRWICTRNRQTYGNINEKQQMWLTASGKFTMTVITIMLACYVRISASFTVASLNRCASLSTWLMVSLDFGEMNV